MLVPKVACTKVLQFYQTLGTSKAIGVPIVANSDFEQKPVVDVQSTFKAYVTLYTGEEKRKQC